MKGRKISVIISIIALIFASINLIYSSAKGLPTGSAAILFCAVLVVLYGNYKGYKSQNKK